MTQTQAIPAPKPNSTLTIGIVAGEPSGDILAAGLMAALRQQAEQTNQEVEFIGIGGPRMMEVGLECLFPMDAITMMGLEEGFAKVASILSIRRRLYRKLKTLSLDAFIGVDVPDFNLTIEEKLKSRGVPTIHYVSPTVWAWRGYRIKKIGRAVSRMLTLFPFEQQFYQERAIAATFVGHPAASRISLSSAIEEDDIEQPVETDQILIGLLPGSRSSEVRTLLKPMLVAAEFIAKRDEKIKFALPIAKPELAECVQQLAAEHPDLPLEILDGQSEQVLGQADYAIVASGTAALEALLHITPMLVVYKVSRLTAWMVRFFGHVSHYSMPNHLLPDPDVPELIQEQVTPANIAERVFAYMDSPDQVATLKSQFENVARTLQQDSSALAASAVLTEINAH